MRVRGPAPRPLPTSMPRPGRGRRAHLCTLDCAAKEARRCRARTALRQVGAGGAFASDRKARNRGVQPFARVAESGFRGVDRQIREGTRSFSRANSGRKSGGGETSSEDRGTRRLDVQNREVAGTLGALWKKTGCALAITDEKTGLVD